MPVPCTSVEQPGWLTLRQQLWPHCSLTRHLTQMGEFLAAPGRFTQFIEYDSAGAPIGFIEASLRTDYVNGTTSSPVAFLEGLYVVPTARRRGVGRMLVASVERWAVDAGCTEFASDTTLDNVQSQRMHLALGFKETQRYVFFKKALP
ncbi:MAG TPA: aminoglycoside 6'-N-acetyltransferase [Steroidobacteraceae bacterium]|nr:aminoglycoside 6'-N-acetyltransferase [Steroidobacteraceae bacterium]